MSKDFLDFLQDEDFVQWVKNPTKERSEYWQTWMEVHPEQVEAIEKARQLLVSLRFDLPEPDALEKREVFENILRKTGRRTYKSGYSFIQLNWNYLLKIAATVLIFISAVFAVYNIARSIPDAAVRSAPHVVTKQTPKGQKMHTVLPDGTHVWLNAGSKISWDQTFNINDRSVALQGEAFFEVAEDSERRFEVISGPLRTQAVGTSFNINAYDDSGRVEVSLLTGKVKVTHEEANDRFLLLTSGEKAISKKHSTELFKSTLHYRKDIGWREDLLYFENAGFSKIKKRLERWYGVSIVSVEGATFRWNYTGEFQKQSLEMVLTRISFTENFRFRIDGDTVTIYNK